MSGDRAVQCLTLVFNTLLRQANSRELDTLIEMCLGIFLAPPKPIADDIRLVRMSFKFSMKCGLEGLKFKSLKS